VVNHNMLDRIHMLQKKQLQMNHRVLDIMRKMEVLRCHGVPLQENERRFYQKLLELVQRIDQPLRSVQEMTIHASLHEQPNDITTQSMNDEDLQNFILALRKQSDGLEQLIEIIR
jgi:hypothetical protein